MWLRAKVWWDWVWKNYFGVELYLTRWWWRWHNWNTWVQHIKIFERHTKMKVCPPGKIFSANDFGFAQNESFGSISTRVMTLLRVVWGKWCHTHQARRMSRQALHTSTQKVSSGTYTYDLTNALYRTGGGLSRMIFFIDTTYRKDTRVFLPHYKRSALIDLIYIY